MPKNRYVKFPTIALQIKLSEETWKLIFFNFQCLFHFFFSYLLFLEGHHQHFLQGCLLWSILCLVATSFCIIRKVMGVRSLTWKRDFDLIINGLRFLSWRRKYFPNRSYRQVSNPSFWKSQRGNKEIRRKIGHPESGFCLLKTVKKVERKLSTRFNKLFYGSKHDWKSSASSEK